MTRHARARALSVACIFAALLPQARGEVLDGVQPAALDQPQINAIIYLGDNTAPQTGVTTDPLGGLLGDLGLGDSTTFFNVQAYLDTGASGILISTATATALNIATEQQNGLPVIYSDVGVAGSDNFNVSQLLRLRLAPYIPGVDMDQFTGVSQTVPVTTPYTMAAPASGTLRAQVGPYVPPVDNPVTDEIDELIRELSQTSLDVVGMPAIQGHVMVIDPSGVKDLGLLFSALSGGLDGITDAQLDSISSAGVRTYLYDRSTAPVFNATRTTDPGIPTPQRHVALTYASFDRFTEVKLGTNGTASSALPAPTLAHNPFIGKNPVALMEGQPAGDAPGITITRTSGGTVLPSTGNWLLDTGAAASIISEAQAGKLNVKYADGRRPGPPPDAGTDSAPDTGPLLVDKSTGITIPDQFTLTLGGIGGNEVLAGFWLDSLLLPTTEGTAFGSDALNIHFTHVPVLVGNITVADPLNPTQTLTLDGIFGMNMLIESINFQTDDVGNITDLGDPSPSFFQWITFDEPNAKLGLVFDSSAVPDAAILIDQVQPYYTASGVSRGTVLPDFAGGTLRIDVGSTLGQGFIIAASGGTIDTYGNVVDFTGGSIIGAGGLRITDSLHSTNGSGGGTYRLGEAATYGGDTTIDSGATAELTAAGAGFPDTNLILNGSFMLNGWGQTVASLTGTDPTAVLDLGDAGGFTINGSTATVFAGAIVSSSAGSGAQGAATPASATPATFALKGAANVTLTGISSYSGATTLEAGTTLTLKHSGKITHTASVSNGGSLNLTDHASLTASGTVANTGSVLVASGAALTANRYAQSGCASTLLADGTITAPTVNITGGTFGGHGTVYGNVTLENGALQVGASPDALHIAGDFTQTGGAIAFEIDPDGQGGFVFSTLIFDPGSNVSVQDATIAFNFKNGADPKAFFKTGLFNLDTFLNGSDGHAFSSEFAAGSVFQNDTFTASSSDFSITSFAFAPDTGAAGIEESVPEPATLALLAVPALLLLKRRDGRSASR